MAKISHTFEYLLARGGISFANLLSAKSADSFGRGLGNLFHLLLPKRQQIAYDNLQKAFGDELPEDEKRLITKKVFQSIGQTYIELARFQKIGQEAISEIIVHDGMENFHKAKKEGNGAIVLTSHFGNWEIGAAWVASEGFEIDVLVKVQSNPLVDKLVTNLREQTGINVIPVHQSTLRDIVKALRQNRFVAIAADQHDPSGNLILDFFGRKASIARGPASFAKKHNCPILPVMSKRESYLKHRIIAHSPIYPSSDLDVEEDIKRMTIEYLKFFEDVIRQYPEQWMWTHRRWKI